SARCHRGRILAATARFGYLVTTREESLNIACGLPQSLPVLDQGDTDEPFAIFAKADTWRYRHIGLFEQQLGEPEAADRAEGVRDRRPREHRSVGCRYLPPGLTQPVDENIAA